MIVSRPRIAFAITHSEAAGAQAVWADLALAFRDRDCDVFLIAIYPSQRQLLKVGHGLSWTHCVERIPRTASDVISAVIKARKLLASIKADVIFTALPAANVIFPIINGCTRRPAKVYTSHHSPTFTHNCLLNSIDNFVGTSGFVDGVICVSHAVKSSLERKFDRYRSKCSVIRNALPPEIEAHINKLALDDNSVPQARKKIVACGRLAAQKNYSVLIRAMAEVRDAQLEILGEGPDQASLQALARECGVEHRVTFSGVKERHDALKIMAQSQIFVQPSLFEGHSLAIVEASKLGLPIIVSSVPSQSEAVTRSDQTICALTHNVDDHVELACCIKLLLHDDAEFHRYCALSKSLGVEVNFAQMVDQYASLVLGHMSGYSQPVL